jgi:hypothetical protein
MKSEKKFPDWILNAVHKNKSQLNSKSIDFYDKFLEYLPHFDSCFISIPTTSAIGVLKSYAPDELEANYGFKSSVEFILLNIFEKFHYQATYQLRELAISLFEALGEGRFYVSALLNRAMLEVVCVNYYTLTKVESKFMQNLKYLQSAIKTKSPDEKEKLLKIYYQGVYDVFSKLFDANTSASLDWQKYLDGKFGIIIPKSEKKKIIHVHDGIRDLEKASGLPLWEVYSTLSEFVHPNLGSKMLIINTKHEHFPFMDEVILGDNKGNSEAAIFYIDHIAESMYYTVTLSLTLFDRGQKLISLLDHMSSENGGETVH